MRRARHKKEKQIDAQETSEQHRDGGSGDDAQPNDIEIESAHSVEGENF